MGMFDSVYFNCPDCGREIEAQSKSGRCLLNTYSHVEVPKDVAEDIDRHAPFECTCGSKWGLVQEELDFVRFRPFKVS